MFLVYGGCEEELALKGYVDPSLGTDPDDSKSQTGYVFMFMEARLAGGASNNPWSLNIQWSRNT